MCFNIPYFLENKPWLIFFYEMKFFGLLSNRVIFEEFSEKRKNNLNNFSQPSIFGSKEYIYESSEQGQLEVAETELLFFSAITNNMT